ncbi:class I SAM-dependent RNA methyltransferase [Microbacterium sp. STN6]|uniref:class I SAM-dependent RNA methyltransferase n=1 Tax=Microbacterium sp. STN6 TaxID=2995588 RepID=UPI002260CEE6|nr:class I SAM-dependent RNA methyltransferase [Microbacterium sp. STN6]MCX7520986.1 class I SAM-dependent RNA methyltransferase [Microbacterium sp. STN6]
MAHGGVFVARHEGRVVFVADAVDGERVLARITDDTHDRFWRAETLEVLEPSPHRREHVWPEAALARDPAERAGGAEFGHIALPHQRELKRRVITDALSRMAGIERDVTVEAADGDDAGNGLAWRTRVRLQVGERGEVGPFAARSHHVVPVRSLPLAVPAVADAAPLDGRLEGAASVDVIASGAGDVHVIVNPRDEKRRRGAAPTAGALITEAVAGREFQLDAGGFWQVHRRAPETLFRAVQEAIDPSLFDPAAANLDLYGGVGLLAAAVGDRFGPATRITSVESFAPATRHAGRNLADWRGAEAVTARVDRYLARLEADAPARERARLSQGTVVLDPPRSGAGREVVDGLAALGPAQLVYVACDPVALARDLALFADRGYELRQLRAFDLFPHTHHVEAIATLAPAS